MLVTIGICCFDAEDTIERSVRAAQALKWPELEIVVVDDASTDRSVEIVEGFAREDARIRLIRSAENKGAAEARNTIVREAKGEYIAFQDDDDESLPDRVSRQIELLSRQPRLAACFVSRTVAKPGAPPSYSKAMGVEAFPRGEAIALCLLCGDPIDGAGRFGAGTMMASAETFRAVGRFDESLKRAEELEWMVRFALLGGEVRGTAEPLLAQHITRGADKGRRRSLAGRLAAVRLHRPFLKRHRAYWAAHVFAYQDYFYVARQMHRARLAALALLVLRPKVTLDMLRRKWLGRQSEGLGQRRLGAGGREADVADDGVD